ncbi:uncharacterized protein LOC126846165 [Adelges cooleyi]|uniref:uncharacterized protein LOC126846165 n=1 Tax=Adelges cooleyi TaxID=133065 RepID=UPI00218016C5|nr:uncharacterized protein LOC126846165 [Adelges cooleyi]
MWLIGLIFLAVVSICFLFMHYSKPQNNLGPFFDFYKLPGRAFYPKYVLYYLFFTLVKTLSQYFNVQTKYGKPEDNDGPHVLGDNVGFDATWIGGTDSNGKWIILALDRRNDHNMSVGYLCLYVPEVGLLTTSVLRDSAGRSKLEFAVDECGLTMETPLREWSFRFEGEMLFVDDPEKRVNVKIVGNWRCKDDVWILNRDFSSKAFAESFALEECSRVSPFKYRGAQEMNTTVHWEQFGRLDADIEIFGKNLVLQNATAFRDRSFGRNRDYSSMHRYIFILMYLDDGRNAVFCVVCQTEGFSRLYYGYVRNLDGTCTNVDWSDFSMYRVGENGRPSEELSFLVEIDNRMHPVQLVCSNRRWFPMENDGVLRCEQMGRCLFGDQPGKYLAQWQYNQSTLKAKRLGKAFASGT